MGLGSGIRDPGYGKNLFRIPDPGVKKAPDPDPQHFKLETKPTCNGVTLNVERRP
jgi:hypothetical protein